VLASKLSIDCQRCGDSPRSVEVRRLFAATEQSNVVAEDVHIEAEPFTKSVEVQTMYRESESQTDPYTPDYLIPKGENPEVLVLSNLGHGKPTSQQCLLPSSPDVL
jgi:hypothetical protein